MAEAERANPAGAGGADASLPNDETTAVDGTPEADAAAPEPAGATHAQEDEAWNPHDAEHPDPVDRVAALEAELADSQAKFLRARADYDNLVRRTEDERGRLQQAAAARIIERFLDPLEVLDKAAADVEQADAARGTGVRLAYNRFMDALRHEGLEPVPGVGSSFDHHHHEAVAREASEQPEGEIIEVVRAGYRLGGRLLRAALVKVSAGPD